MNPILLGLLLFGGLAAGCGGSPSSGPTGPSPGSIASPGPSAPAGLAPSILQVYPNEGVVTGGTQVQVLGAGLGPRSIVTFDGLPATMKGWSPGGDSLWALTPGHASGAVDVAVMNPDGQSGKLAAGFTYGQAARLIIGALSTSVGLTAGGTYLSIGGSGLQPGVKVTLGGTDARVIYSTPGWVGFATRPHAAGTVDVVVTGADGQVARLDGAYTYIPPRFSDFNGTWAGYVGDEGELPITFTVENDILVSVSCGGSALTLGALPPTSGGGFSVTGGRGATMTGGLLKADYAEGAIDMARCTYDTVWTANRR